MIFNEVAVGRLTLETTFDESDSPQSRFVRSPPFVSSTLPYHIICFVSAWLFVFILGHSSLGYSPDDEAVQQERPKTLPSGAKFARSKSDRFASLRKNLFTKRNDTAVRNSEMALSDDEPNLDLSHTVYDEQINFSGILCQVNDDEVS
ncbi:hypothetical protein LOAG_10186 [Loa loa]|uniref:Uncharacterized protein n=1 Tax=Loa loa TaxID=7209 RepID=A0A1S0TQA7_LOALO|nr:hypothetical protein LOAG_10186 [Loa loa]EFO18310.1 hypothetical protein LOAG_10186 [Loa loa]